MSGCGCERLEYSLFRNVCNLSVLSCYGRFESLAFNEEPQYLSCLHWRRRMPGRVSQVSRKKKIWLGASAATAALLAVAVFWIVPEQTAPAESPKPMLSA